MAEQDAARKQEAARRAAARALAAKQAEVARLRHATQQQQRRLAADQVLPWFCITVLRSDGCLRTALHSMG